MAEDEPEISILDARLAEIDRRLSRIQTGLTEDADADAGAGLDPRSSEPRASAAPVALAPDDDPGRVVAELRGLIAEHARLLDTMGELVASGERILARSAETAMPAAVTAAGTGGLSVAAGPFGSVDAVRDFERAVRTLPGVAAVEVRGYEAGDRAVLDVHLSGSTS